MNKPIDDLFEEARASFQANIPLEKVETLIQRSASPSSKWTWKTIISSMSIIGIIVAITLGSLLMTASKTPIAGATSLPVYSTLLLEESALVEPHFSPLKIIDQHLYLPSKDSTPPAPMAPPTLPPLAPVAAPVPPVPPVPPHVNRPSFMDSLGPKKTFTEYTLEIRKDNSEKELKALQKELGRYGIQLKIKQLTYHPDKTIKRFKGRFETDSLFCSTQMNEHEFDIQGAFKSMQFTFRVADEKNLKYLKIQSDDFEQTIECYDDKVLTSSIQAKKIAKEAERAMREVERKMYHIQKEAEAAQRQLQMAQQEAARSRANILRLKADSFHFMTEKQFLDSFPKQEWALKHEFFPDSAKNMTIYFGNLESQLKVLDRFAEEDLFQMDSLFFKSTLKNYSDEFRFEIENTRLDIEQTIQDHFQLKKDQEAELEKRVEKLLERYEVELDLKKEDLEKEAAQLEEEAKRLLKAAKELKKAAKQKRADNEPR